MQISAKELAKLINVSPATISMVFHDKPGISDATREMVFAAASKYGYTFRKSTPVSSSTQTIQLVNWKKHGKICSDTPFFSQVTEGITQECAKQNYLLSISYLYENLDLAPQLAALKSVNCAGILLMATEMNQSDFEYFRDFHVPILVLDCYYDELPFDCVLINNIQGAFNATNYLIGCGHKKVGYLRSNVSISNFDERADGYFKALRAHNISTSHPYVHAISPASDEGYRDMTDILSSRPELADAYFADNDIIAASAMKAFRDYGYEMPKDISIIGFDDMPLCDMMIPSLTTMRVEKKELGISSVQRLIERIERPEKEYMKMAMHTNLVKRESVSVCR